MENKAISPIKLKILMAKHIKSCQKKLKQKEVNKIEVEFVFEWLEDMTMVKFGEAKYLISGKWLMPDLFDLVKESLEETCCDGVMTYNMSSCSVILFGKPVKPFNMLQRLIQKYSGIGIKWSDFKTETQSVSGNFIDSKRRYLCYNENACQEGIDFIRNKRSSKDVLKTYFIVERNKPYVTSAIKLEVQTMRGKKKSEFIVRP